MERGVGKLGAKGPDRGQRSVNQQVDEHQGIGESAPSYDRALGQNGVCKGTKDHNRAFCSTQAEYQTEGVEREAETFCHAD